MFLCARLISQQTRIVLSSKTIIRLLGADEWPAGRTSSILTFELILIIQCFVGISGRTNSDALVVPGVKRQMKSPGHQTAKPGSTGFQGAYKNSGCAFVIQRLIKQDSFDAAIDRSSFFDTRAGHRGEVVLPSCAHSCVDCCPGPTKIPMRTWSQERSQPSETGGGIWRSFCRSNWSYMTSIIQAANVGHIEPHLLPRQVLMEPSEVESAVVTKIVLLSRVILVRPRK